jgi:hypothetical protein
MWVTPAEHHAIAHVLASCPGQTVPAETRAPVITYRPTTPTTPSTPSLPRTSAPAAPVYYANCAAVRAAGKAPLYRGQPGYRAGLDRDGDGVACE